MVLHSIYTHKFLKHISQSKKFPHTTENHKIPDLSKSLISSNPRFKRKTLEIIRLITISVSELCALWSVTMSAFVLYIDHVLH